MIKPGTNLCRVCGKTSTEHFYRSGKTGPGAELIWDPSQKKFILKPLPSAVTQSLYLNLAEPVQYSDTDFPPKYIQAQIGTDPNVITMYRSCPHCKDHEIFPPDMGKLPCFVIAVIGAMRAGKTAWLGALNNALNALNKQSYPYKIEPWKLRGDSEAVQSTRGYEDGNTNYFLIVDTQTGENVAMIYLLDYAGELYDGQAVNPGTALGKILLGKAGPGYPGLDGAVFIEPAVDDPLNKDRSGTDNVINVIADQEFKNILRKIPVARVCTFADKLIELETAKLLRSSGYIPRLTANTFPRTVYANVDEANANANKNLRHHYTPEAIIRRSRLQNHIAEEIIDSCEVGKNLKLVLNGRNKQFAHFLVQSCEHVPSPDPEDSNDPQKPNGSNNYRKQFNAADPLIWILNKLKLFPLFLTEGGNW